MVSSGTKRFFVSYRRRADKDRELASYLVERLERAGHEVFIDLQMPIGTRWVDEIERRIAWCDYIIVLLSEDSIHSEMVQGEVRRAHRRCEKEGRPTTLPVRVRYEGPLGYELDSYLSPIQQKLWTGADDSEKLLSEILDASESCASTERVENSEDVSAEASPADPRRPLPAKDPRILRAPGGALRPDDPFYIRREADERIDLVAGSRGETIVIKAPRQMGKSSLLIRYLEACREAGKHFAFVDFQSFGERDLADYGSLLNRLATALLRCFKIPAQQIPGLPDQLAFTNFVEDTILANLPGPTYLRFRRGGPDFRAALSVRLFRHATHVAQQQGSASICLGERRSGAGYRHRTLPSHRRRRSIPLQCECAHYLAGIFARGDRPAQRGLRRCAEPTWISMPCSIYWQDSPI